jgi:cyclophilin family peptidyl-prolyl cis-trans isomerase
MDWALFQYRYLDHTKHLIYKKKANDNFRKVINDSPNRNYIFMDVKVGEDHPIKVVFELFSDIAPKTCENFRRVCNEVYTNKKGEKLTYSNTKIHRVVKGAYVQGGNLNSIGVNNQKSIYEGEFPDESYSVKHDAVGLIGMCKRSGFDHTNESQFYVTISSPLSFLDNKFVVFGRVIQGMRAFRLIEKLDCENEKPKKDVAISSAGDFIMKKGK